MLTQIQAQSQLQLWLDAWRQGMSAPLPVAFKTALTFLRTAHAGKVDPWENAEKSYASEDAFARAERDEAPALARTFNSVYEMSGFEHWSERLYGGLFRWVVEGPST
jgi:exodeoxyribonuclease V gamma subunit